jgi:hypothetical protein
MTESADCPELFAKSRGLYNSPLLISDQMTSTLLSDMEFTGL